MCECNGNTNIDDRDSCDQVTGVCKKCRFNTDGDKCEKCLPGYFGNALNHDCKRKNISITQYILNQFDQNLISISNNSL